MRVVAGKYKGKMLKSPFSNNIRPTGDKVKQALFTKLQFFVKDKVVVDLFCGSGALGIEAISHGAKFVYFFDKDKRSILLTKQNLVGITEEHEVITSSYEKALKGLNNKVDLFLIDPPYASGVYEDVLKIIKQNNLLANGGYIVCEHPTGMKITSDFVVLDKKNYGTVELTYLGESCNEE